MAKRSQKTVDNLEQLAHTLATWEGPPGSDERFALRDAVRIAKIIFRSRLDASRKARALLAIVEFQQAFADDPDDDAVWENALYRVVDAAEGN